MPINRVDITDNEFEQFIYEGLVEYGYSPRKEGDILHLEGVGVGEGNSSVDIELNLVEMDGHKILEVTALLRMDPVTFEKATLMSVQGNLSCLIAKFQPVEQIEIGLHKVRASFTLFADQLSLDELSSMLYLFIKEADAIDDAIAF